MGLVMFVVGSIHLEVLIIGLLCLTNMFIQANDTKRIYSTWRMCQHKVGDKAPWQ